MSSVELTEFHAAADGADPQCPRVPLRDGWRVGRAVPVGALVLIVLAAGNGCGGSSAAEHLEAARTALRKGEYERAVVLAERITEDAAEWNAARLVGGEAETRLGNAGRAVAWYQAVNFDGSREAQLARFALAEVLRSTGRLAEAAEHYRLALEQNPEDSAVHERLAFLLSTCGQAWEAAPHFEFLIRSGTARLEELVLFADLGRPVEQEEYLRSCFEQASEDSFVELGLAALAFHDGRRDEAIPALRRVIATDPGLLSAQAMLGELLIDAPPRQFDDWLQQLPPDSAEHPEIWYVKGVFLRRQGDVREAAGCFREALAHAPTHRRSTWQLSQMLAVLEHPDLQIVTQLSERQNQLSQSLDDVLRSEGRNPEAVRTVVEQLDASGRIWETCAWGLWAEEAFPGIAWPRRFLNRHVDRLTESLPLVAPEHDPGQWFAADEFPVPERITVAKPAVATSGGADEEVAIRFERASSEPAFRYFNGDDPATPGLRMFEQTGGGVAVIDFDRDLAPDLFFPQGLAWPTGSDQPVTADAPRDGLFRNRLGDAYRDVGDVAGIGAGGFGQGATVGDFDSDGFADLYVANVGRNQLLLNNGDGTFRDVSESAGLSIEAWTTSVLMVDLNEDGHPDLYDVGYLEGPDVYHRICGGKACSPSNFRGCRDRVFVGRGDGTVTEVVDATPVADSKGLGIITLYGASLRRPDLFIANDQVANHFLSSVAEGPHKLTFVENALVAGLAFNENGLSMACMGIAADDVNQDGRVDLYVTNFRDETNTLYLQDASGLFTDWTRVSGLAAPSLPYVGWGTQFLDADLDGDSDLVVTNGHVDDYRDEGGEYQMRPQFYRSLGNSQFRELQPSSGDSFFATPISGRALARLDHNGDGRSDFVVTCLLDNVRLCENRTAAAGRSLQVWLHAVNSARDAMGARVRVRAGRRTWTRYLLAGDGYQCSNERLVPFGLGEISAIDELSVEWPSGAVSTLRSPPPDSLVILVEGRPSCTIRVNDRLMSGSVEMGERP